MEIKPLKAYRFNKDLVGDVSNCIAPPYDVINDKQQQKLYEKSQYNIVRIIRGKTEPSDNGQNNQYTRAAEYLKDWIEKGVLKQDDKEAIYVYVQDFELAGAWFQRFSFIALAKLKEFGETVRPHEWTLEKQREDRLNLERATKARFGLVFMLYEDERNVAEKIIEKNINKQAPIDFTDDQNVRHRLFAISSNEEVEAIVKMMSDKSCIIADGHHRYETALAYSKESNNPAAAYLMSAFSNTIHEGLIVLATHRVVGKLQNFDFERLLSLLKENFEITKYAFSSPKDLQKAKKKMLSQMKSEHAQDKNAFGIYGGNNAFYAAALKDSRIMDSAEKRMSPAWKALDVAVLSKLILEKLLGIGKEELSRGENVEYVKDSGNQINELVSQIDSREKQVVFFMNPPKMKQIQMVAEAGERMPQKSTYFYPKVFSGLTIDKL